MKHYICTGGCKTEEKIEGKCEVASCPNHAKTLEQCMCTDGKHYGRHEKGEEVAEEKSEEEKKKNLPRSIKT